MNRELVAKTETFLKETFAASEFFQANPSEAAYRLEHSYRVANIAKRIAAEENLSVEDAVVAGLLHDIAYCEEMKTAAITAAEALRSHGRFWDLLACHPTGSMQSVTGSLSMWMTHLPLNGSEPHSVKQ